MPFPRRFCIKGLVVLVFTTHPTAASWQPSSGLLLTRDNPTSRCAWPKDGSREDGWEDAREPPPAPRVCSESLCRTADTNPGHVLRHPDLNVLLCRKEENAHVFSTHQVSDAFVSVFSCSHNSHIISTVATDFSSPPPKPWGLPLCSCPVGMGPLVLGPCELACRRQHGLGRSTW